MLGETVRTRGVPVACMDHHVSEGVLPDGPRYLDAGAAATGELVFELAVANGWTLTEEAARGLYVAILTDTGGFRFSNTRPRTLRVAAELLEVGVDPGADLSRGLRPGPRGSPPALRRGAADARGRAGSRTGLGHRAAGRHRAPRRLVGRSRRRGGVPALDRGRAHGAAVPGGEPGTGEGLAPLGRRRGRRRVRQAVRRRRPHQGRRARAPGLAGGRAVHGPDRRPGVSGAANGRGA